jgi:hypothetical protein
MVAESDRFYAITTDITGQFKQQIQPQLHALLGHGDTDRAENRGARAPVFADRKREVQLGAKRSTLQRLTLPVGPASSDTALDRRYCRNPYWRDADHLSAIPMVR